MLKNKIMDVKNKNYTMTKIHLFMFFHCRTGSSSFCSNILLKVNVVVNGVKKQYRNLRFICPSAR